MPDFFKPTVSQWHALALASKTGILSRVSVGWISSDNSEAQPPTSEKITVASFERRKPARRPLPEHLPRERIVYPPPSACPCCGGTTLRKIGEDVTETLELVPRQ